MSCVRVTCTLAENDVAGAPPQDLGKAASRTGQGAAQRGPVSSPCKERHDKGTVKWLNAEKGFGFISRTDGLDAFVHYSEIDGAGVRGLEENQHVEFEWPRGRRARRRPASCPSRPTSPRDAVHRHVRVGGGL